MNAFRHSHASSIAVELEYAVRQMRIRVRDNGCGIDQEILRTARNGHWGLSRIASEPRRSARDSKSLAVPRRVQKSNCLCQAVLPFKPSLRIIGWDGCHRGGFGRKLGRREAKKEEDE